MTKCVSYVPDEAIEKDAQALLAEYADARGVTIEAPIAIDDIIEKHLKIGIEFDDTHRLFGVPRSGIGFDPDILGAIFFEQKRIVIDESLDPDENPAKEGRYRYTAAHEVGHWRLHRHLFGRDPAQTSMLDANTPPSVICRTSQAKARIELQADLYASCVLMPRKLVFAAWEETFPDRKQRVLQPSEPIDHPFVEIARFEIRHLRQTILNLAVRGKLVPQDPNDEPASELLKWIAKEKGKLVKAGEITREKSLPQLSDADTAFELPQGWVWVRLGELTKLVTSGSRDWAKHYSSDGAIFVRMGNLSKDHYCLRLDHIQRVTPPPDGEGTRTSDSVRRSNREGRP